MSKKIPKKLLWPQYWLMWMLLGFLYLLVKLPYRWQLSIGHGIGFLAYWVLPRRRRINEINAKLCFPELDAMARRQFVKKCFASNGMAILETAMAWWWSQEKLQALWHIEGYEHIEAAFAQGKGVLLIGAHFATVDMVSRYAGSVIPMHVTYREQKNPVIDYLLKQNRHQSLMQIIHRHDVREVVRQLKKGKIVWYAADQDYGRKHSVFAPFFGVSAATITVPSWYAKMSEASVVMVSYYRLPDAQGYRLVFGPTVKNYPSEDDVADAAHLNQEIEKLIRVAPEQYFWVHRRFKTRPVGEKRFY
jgi:KDO2-lipid IV(A) lauroyltransferase